MDKSPSDLYGNPHRVPYHEHGSWSGCMVFITAMWILTLQLITFAAFEIIRPGVIREAGCVVFPFLCGK